MNPDNYGSLPACKKLAEVLAKKEKKIETEFWWVNFPQTGWGIVKKADAEFVDRPDSIPAPSMAEVWRELPEVIVKDKLEYYKIIMSGATAGETYCGYFNQGKRQWLWGFNNTNPTDALIDLWVWVLQEGT